MKKKILIIFTGAMDLGGIERSLIGLLNAIDYSRYDVDLFLYGHHGPLFKYIDHRVNILPEVRELSYLRDSFLKKITHGSFFSAGLRIRDFFLSKYKRVYNDQTWAEILDRYVPKNNCTYDMAIGFFRPFDYLINKVKARVKIGWIHTDYSDAENNDITVERDYMQVPLIAAVSEKCREAFCRKYPSFEERTVVIENIYSVPFICHQADAFVPKEMLDDSSVKLLSIGRFCTAKNFDNIPDICRRIIEKGVRNIKWFIIGYGNDEKLIRRKIKESGMFENVIILGKKENPYPYIKNCDLYVQPSRYEGKCVSVVEAQILQKPVVITNYFTSTSQLNNGVDGLIVPIDNDGCAEGIVRLLKDGKTMRLLSDNCSKSDYSNKSQIKKLYQIIERE